MTSPKGTDELFWDKEFEDVHDWVERVEMTAEVIMINEKKLFKTREFNLKGELKEWFKKMAIVPTN
jgi:predicted house-cleaning noncanonical NTP pyrophosphatase (MazG superfamily)